MKMIRLNQVSPMDGATPRSRTPLSPGRLPAVAFVLMLALVRSTACGDYAQLRLLQLAREAVSAETGVARTATAALRAEGPAGLDILLQIHGDALKAHLFPGVPSKPETTDDSWARLKTALDAVGAQRDCYASGLYWYTDFEQAMAAAKTAGKPILSLRLLGKLDEEFSCANSRFFRTTLYANTEVSQYLRDHFVLHWKSVRPVPRVTIDFGDGRRLERTITGNSIHYVLDAEGRVIDALPGLYGAREFIRGLERAAQAARQCSNLAAAEREESLQAYHRGRLNTINAQWTADLARLKLPSALTLAGANPPASSTPPPAVTAARVAVTKMPAEMPILRRTQPKSGGQGAQSPVDADDATWAAIADIHADGAQLDPAARNLIRMKGPTAADASALTLGKRQVEDPLLRTMRNLERSIAEDTVRNEYLLHARIHQWLAMARRPENVEQLNRKVYAELFLTPDSDPWLGLVTPGVFSALENDGLVQATMR
jgi:hypothetical protein